MGAQRLPYFLVLNLAVVFVRYVARNFFFGQHDCVVDICHALQKKETITHDSVFPSRRYIHVNSTRKNHSHVTRRSRLAVLAVNVTGRVVGRTTVQTSFRLAPDR